MEKLSMCRICLVDSVRIHVVFNRNLQAVYEKLTDTPFVTEDHRPMLACFFCYTKLKQCWQLQRKCLEAEEVFAQMLNEGFEYSNRSQLGYFDEFILTPIVHISLGNICEKESTSIKEELPAVSETQDDIEHPSDGSEPDNTDYSEANQQATMLHHYESEDDLPLINIKTEVEEEKEVPQENRSADETTRAPGAKRPKTVETILVTKKNKHGHTGSGVTGLTNQHTTKCDRKCYECDICQRSFALRSSLRRHIRRHSGDKPYKCKICQSSFTQNSSLKVHIRTHTGEKPFKCDICQRRFTKKSDLKVHIRIHTGENPFKCDICQRSFTNKSDLKVHIRIHTGEKPYKCDICQRKFTQKSDLKVHIRIHTGEKPFKCDICQRSFTKRSDLKVHIRIHTGENPFKCDICQRSFTHNSSFKVHIRTHTGDKPFKCDICQRSFNHKSNLKRHIRTHIGDKLYKCDICKRSFTRMANLIIHTRIHTGDKPYKCNICQRSFSQKTNHLKTHMRTHTGDKSYKCEICQRSFTRNFQLKKHSRTHTVK